VTRARRLAAIMFTDMVGYSAMAQRDEEGALEALALHNRELRPIFERFHGREIKTIGDCFLLEFDSALDAVQCAVEAQRHLRSTPLTGVGGQPIQIRIGIHLGDVVEESGDVLGDAVNIASRLEPLAGPGGICLSQQVYDLVQNKVPATFERLPRVSLKNISEVAAVYRIRGDSTVRPSRAPPANGSDGKHLAVLPLANISQEPEDDYFADGLTDELISVLSQIRGLSVIARTSVMPYKRSPKSIPEVAAELGVEVILEGSVRKAGNKVRVTLRLVDATTQRHLWAGIVNRDLDDIFAVQSDVASKAARALRLTLTQSRRSSPRPPPKPNPRWGVVTEGAAYDFYLRGLAATSHLSDSGPEDAFRWFEKATRLDPGLADAYAAWANLYTIAAGDYFPMREGMGRAKELAARALAIDPGSSDAHAAQANIAMQFDNDWRRAESEFLVATQLNPSNVTAYRFYGMLLSVLGRFDEAKQAFRQAIRLDPSGHYRHQLAWAELESGNPEAAFEYLAGDSAQPPHAGHHQHVAAMFYLAAGRRAEGLHSLDAAGSSAGPDDPFELALVNALFGRCDAAHEVLREYELGKNPSYLSPGHAALMYAAVGKNERALDLLEKDMSEGDHILWLHYRHCAFDRIRGHPRFLAMMRKLGLPVQPIRDWLPPAN
jgi:adenylate cyclase